MIRKRTRVSSCSHLDCHAHYRPWQDKYAAMISSVECYVVCWQDASRTLASARAHTYTATNPLVAFRVVIFHCMVPSAC